MITNTELLTIFRDKLEQTNSLDAAFLKAAWTAYKKGIEDSSRPPADWEKVAADECEARLRERAMEMMEVVKGKNRE